MTAAWQPPVNTANRFAHIDALRAFAVLLVVVAHAGLGNVIPGGSGVTIFFSVSGFIITYLLLRERERTGGFGMSQFYVRRAIKIAPPFLLVVVLPTLIYAQSNRIDTSAVLAQIFFVFNWIAYREHYVLPGSDVVWSLAIEEQFYIAFAVLWLFVSKRANWRALIMTCAVVAIVAPTLLRVILATDADNSARIYYGSDTRLDSIAWGVLAAIVYDGWVRGGRERSRLASIYARDWVVIAAIATYVASLVIRDEWFRDTLRYSMQAVAACAVVLYGLLPGEGPMRSAFYRISTNRLISLIGLSSYSIYLVHNIIGLWLADQLSGMRRPFRVTIVCFVGIAAGIILYQLVEIPARQFGARLRRSASGPSPAPVTGGPDGASTELTHS